MLQVVVQAEHAVEVALVALPVVVDKAQRTLVVGLAVAVHVVVAEVGQESLHLRGREGQAVHQIGFGDAGDSAGLDGLGRPGLVQEEDVGALQQAHLLHAGQGVDLAVLTGELALDVGALFQDLGKVRHVLKVIADGEQHVALGVLDDLAGAHAGVVDRVGTVAGVAEDQVLLLAVDGLGHVLPGHEDIGAVKQVLHDLHVVVVKRGRVLGRIDAERDLLGALVVEDGGLGIRPLVAVLADQFVYLGALAVIHLGVAAAAGRQREHERKKRDDGYDPFHFGCSPPNHYYLPTQRIGTFISPSGSRS